MKNIINKILTSISKKDEIEPSIVERHTIQISLELNTTNSWDSMGFCGKHELYKSIILSNPYKIDIISNSSEELKESIKSEFIYTIDSIRKGLQNKSNDMEIIVYELSNVLNKLKEKIEN